MSNAHIGCSLFCFTSGFVKGTLVLEGCVRTAKRIGCEGYEFVATQMLPHYPFVTDEDVALFSRLTDKYGIAPYCYAANMDRGMRHDRDLTDDEMVAMAVRDIRNAARLGCKAMRQQWMMPPEAFIRLAPYAETYDIQVGIEIHNPAYPSCPEMLAYREVIERSGSRHLGFIPDFGCFATRPNKPHWDRALENGAQPALLEMASRMRYEDISQQEAVRRLREAGANDAVITATMGMYGFVQFRAAPDLEGLASILPYCIEFHGKLHHVSEDLQEASIPYDLIMPIIAQSGFEGFIMAEFENEGGYDEIEMTRRGVAMMKRYLEETK